MDAPGVGVLSVSENGRLNRPLDTLACGSAASPLNDAGPLLAARGEGLVRYPKVSLYRP